MPPYYTIDILYFWIARWSFKGTSNNYGKFGRNISNIITQPYTNIAPQAKLTLILSIKTFKIEIFPFFFHFHIYKKYLYEKPAKKFQDSKKEVIGGHFIWQSLYLLRDLFVTMRLHVVTQLVFVLLFMAKVLWTLNPNSYFLGFFRPFGTTIESKTFPIELIVLLVLYLISISSETSGA
jgi:hypothetical protein